jgi:hypothetical protein
MQTVIATIAVCAAARINTSMKGMCYATNARQNNEPQVSLQGRQ